MSERILKKIWLKGTVDRKAPHLVIGHLKAVRDASKKLKESHNDQALHDFRVALRRLRVCLSAYRDYLGPAGQKNVRKKFKSLAIATNQYRDAEVFLELLNAKSLSVDISSPAVDELKKNLRYQVLRGHEAVSIKVLPETLKMIGTLARQQKTISQKKAVNGYSGPGMKEVFGGRLAREATRLRGYLPKIYSPGDGEAVHAGRIAAKKIRYLMEPFRDELPESRKLLEILKDLQELLGNLHDIGGLKALVLKNQKLKTDRGLKRLVEELARREQKLFKQLDAGWLKKHPKHFFESLKELSQ